MGSHLELASLPPTSQCCHKIFPLGNLGCHSKDDVPCSVTMFGFCGLAGGGLGWDRDNILITKVSGPIDRQHQSEALMFVIIMRSKG